jgi:YegS/Rv2252/BmrU family lipid kinase
MGKNRDVELKPRRRRLRRRALLIINSKSGPQGDSLHKLREVLQTLADVGISADVRVKMKKSVARKDARLAAKRGYRLVIAAGGDGTVATVARGLAGTKATLGILPLGTNNNTATSLGIPRDLSEASALIAAGPAQWVDIGRVRASGHKPAVFLEMAGVGLPAVLTELGQHVEKGRWDAARETLPQALSIEPTVTRVLLDKDPSGRTVRTLFVLIANGPRAGAGLTVAPRARLDDGMLDVHIFEDQDQLALAKQLIELGGNIGELERVATHAYTRCVRVEASRPLPVVADSKGVGTTPATFQIRAHALRVIVGNGHGLTAPVADFAMEKLREMAHPTAVTPEDGEAEPQQEHAGVVRALAAALPFAAAAAGGGVAVALARRSPLR